MAVDREVFRTQGHLIEDSLNIMWADQETRSPHHPLRDLNMLFGYNETLGVWGFRDNVLDAVYDNGSFPSRAPEPTSKVTNKPIVLPTGVILKATGTTYDPAYLELTGDFVAGTTVDVVMEVDSQPGTGATFTTSVNLSAAGAADRWSRLIRGATDITSTSKGTKVFIVPAGAATTITISALTIT